MVDYLVPLYLLSFVSSVISAILALYAIRFSKRTEDRLKKNFVKIQNMMDLQHEKTEDLFVSLENEANNIRSSVHGTRLELLDSIQKVHKIREEILESMQSLEDTCIIPEDENKK